jgi:acetyltransferase-like isoleucine patch superfamily enzyme
MSLLIKLAKKIILPLYWFCRNIKNKTNNKNYSLSPKLKLGKYSMIRKGSEVYNVLLGDYSYISGPNSYVEDAIIGKYCSIARNVIIGVSGHNYEWVTTSPIITSKSYGFINENVLEPQKEIPVIGNDVWVGLNVVIMRGVVIGDGAVIAAGSVVTKNVEPYSITAGIPAKHIKYRFNIDQISNLIAIKWWDWNDDKIKNNSELFYDIDEFIEKHNVN